MNTYSEDKMYESYSSEVERMQKCIDELLQKNQQLKNNINKLQKELNEENLQCSKYSIELNNLKQENKKLNGAIKTYDILLKANVEENKQLKDNWNKLKEFINNNDRFEVINGVGLERIIYTKEIEKFIEELEQGNDSDA